jgi:16S rRNA (cytosine967-C5)-methyltransferase
MLKQDPRQLAAKVLVKVEGGAPAGAALDEALSRVEMDARDRGFATELVDGALRWQGRLDYLLNQVSDKPPAKLDPAVRAVLRLGAYQLTLLRVPAHAAVDSSVKVARRLAHEGAAKFVNAVLRRLEREKDTLPFPDRTEDLAGYLSVVYSHPAWLTARWLERFGLEETEALLQIDNTPPPVTVRANRRWVTREGLQTMLQMHDIETEPTPISAWGLTLPARGNPREMDEYREGLFSVQGEGSMVMVELLRPGRNRHGWDLCAGVGGKATHLAEWTDDSGSLLATDTSADRLKVLAADASRLDLHTISIFHSDARAYPVEPETLDYALLDAPCSGTGSLRRQADARWNKSPDQLTALAALQRELLEAAARALKPGGILLYCTCSLEPEENEEVVDAFLAAHPEWQIDPPAKPDTLPPDVRLPSGCVRLLPHRHNTDGFFAARLVKQG